MGLLLLFLGLFGLNLWSIITAFSIDFHAGIGTIIVSLVIWGYIFMELDI